MLSHVGLVCLTGLLPCKVPVLPGFLVEPPSLVG